MKRSILTATLVAAATTIFVGPPAQAETQAQCYQRVAAADGTVLLRMSTKGKQKHLAEKCPATTTATDEAKDEAKADPAVDDEAAAREQAEREAKAQRDAAAKAQRDRKAAEPPTGFLPVNPGKESANMCLLRVALANALALGNMTTEERQALLAKECPDATIESIGATLATLPPPPTQVEQTAEATPTADTPTEYLTEDDGEELATEIEKAKALAKEAKDLSESVDTKANWAIFFTLLALAIAIAALVRASRLKRDLDGQLRCAIANDAADRVIRRIYPEGDAPADPDAPAEDEDGDRT